MSFFLKLFILFYLFFSTLSVTRADYLRDFIDAVKSDFANLNKTDVSKLPDGIYDENKKDIKPFVSDNNSTTDNNKIEKEDSFFDVLYIKYLAFANERYKKEDFIDAFFFKQKATRILKYKQIAPINPIFFGILPEDIDQFLEARSALKDFSIPIIINDLDGAKILAETYLAYDCWVESLEEGYSPTRVKICKNKFIDNIRALEVIAFKNNIKVNRYENKFSNICKSCDLAKKHYYCNTIYFLENSVTFADGLSIILRKIELKILSMENPNILINYYKKAEITEQRLKIIYNLLQSRIFTNMYNKPIVKIMKPKIEQKYLDLSKYQNSITICING